MTYLGKVRLAKTILLFIAVLPIAFIGYKSTSNLFAQTPQINGLSISTTQPVYAQGQVISVILSNASSYDVFVTNNCPKAPLEVYRWQNNRWVVIDVDSSISKCIGEPATYKIPAKSSINLDYRYWQPLFDIPAKYKIVFVIDNYTNYPYTVFKVS